MSKASLGHLTMEVKKEGEKPQERRKRLLRQLTKVLQAALGSCMMGTLFTFPSVVSSDFANYNTTIYGTTISMEGYVDMIGSMVMAGSLPGAWLTAFVAFRLGRRWSMIVNGVVAVVGWLGVALLPTIAGILVSRCVSGMALGGLSVVINAYSAELADVDVRGMMSVALNMGIFSGQLFTVCIGYGVRYYVVALVDALIPVAFVLCLIWLPESPSILVLKGKEEEAKRVLLDLRGEHADLQAEIQSYKDMNTAMQNGPSWRGLLIPQVLRSLAIVSTLFVLTTFSGFMVLNANASRMFEAAGSTVDGSLSAIVIMIVQFGAAFAGFFLMDKIGRKNILYVGFFLMGIALVALAIFVSVTQQAEIKSVDEELLVLSEAAPEQRRGGWVPLACLVVSQAGVALGVNLMPFLLSQEYFPTSIRSQASSICFTVWTIANFALLQLYTPMAVGLTQPGLYGFYASVCVSGIIFTVFFIRETMGERVG
ncbi:facilitated trehalose transporter Tret1-like [Homarus americanus]|uniref:facilitated trehalose transporter Tret1-like n=1 Tax=Homarus americanus TaxID=6706 RepID=UPI001C44AEC0|nr:facilitated trehalose transporter Tret1-like [Homarus americanus]XP_042234719.1 facilitated trehalose transporter Tret1-like [Homarus americanus]XP_042234720.1 facilitated trehalose transporter Tret1-like [Homarus americanus]XP_042234721.1 facilitated trehalose transporter Tret1-like [Homarus americanus]XP_042234722.1 facilitated trehalose transporter Tret1-like [Homarus americanus]XP_042234723.1 facilitated trehalose transporter Tret1-like [Homarus americanus]XP_042234724.1 facilitated tr